MINNRTKDRLFCFIFGREENKEWTLQLYNAVNGTDYESAEDISIETIESVVYMGMKDDIAFLLYDIISIYEHQSTYNPNMPLRELVYLSRFYNKYIHKNKLNIYSSRQLALPVPKLLVFYNGTAEEPDEIMLRLSDAFPEELREKSDVEIRVRMLNINSGRNPEIMHRCKPLEEYAWFVDKVRMNKESCGLEDAVDRVVNSMPDNFVLKGFLMAHRAEVKEMCIEEYNEAETMQMFREEAFNDGRQKGLEQGLKQGGEIQIRKSITRMIREKGFTYEEACDAIGAQPDDYRDLETA